MEKQAAGCCSRTLVGVVYMDTVRDEPSDFPFEQDGVHDGAETPVGTPEGRERRR
jgi:hypothetical protein